jgi:hypothetical protein
MEHDTVVPLPVYSLPGALDAVLALDQPGMLTDAHVLREFNGGDRFEIGPFDVQTRLLPHSTPNAGVRAGAVFEALVSMERPARFRFIVVVAVRRRNIDRNCADRNPTS